LILSPAEKDIRASSKWGLITACLRQRDVLADVSSSQKIEFNYYGSKCFPIVVPSDPSGKYG
jgi:hypothetical protein